MTTDKGREKCCCKGDGDLPCLPLAASILCRAQRELNQAAFGRARAAGACNFLSLNFWFTVGEKVQEDLDILAVCVQTVVHWTYKK